MILKWIKSNWFVIALVVAVAAGFFFNSAGKALNPEGVTGKAAVFILCFNIGLLLPASALRSGVSNVKLHIFIQAFIFVLIPAYFVITSKLLTGMLPQQFIVGIFALSCLPTTVSTCVVMTQHSNGNTVAAAFNSALANIAGIILTPLILSFLISSSGGNALPAGQIYKIIQGLMIQMLIPMTAGFAIQQAVGSPVKKFKPYISTINSSLIALIVFFSFSKAASSERFVENVARMPGALLYLAVSHFVLIALSVFAAKWVRFDRASVIAVTYVVPQKTIALGAPLLTTYFASDPEMLGMAMLPILFYHPWQLITAALLSRMKFMRGGDILT